MKGKPARRFGKTSHLPPVLLGTWVLLCATATRASDEGAPGTVVATKPDIEPALRAAREHDPRWRAYSASATSPAADDVAPLEALRTAYLGADFLRCLAVAQDAALSRERLLVAGQRQKAARAGLLSAACLHAIGDEPRARQILHGLFVAALDPGAEAVRPDFLAVVKSEREAVQRLATVPLTLTTNPRGADLAVDGQPIACPSRPCRVPLRPGEHIVVARALGRRPTSLPVEVKAATALTITLDWATSTEAERQVEQALAANRPATDAEVLKAASLAMNVSRALGVARADSRHRAVLFDAAGDRVLVTAEGANAAAAVDSALAAWAERNRPPRWWQRPWVWVAASLAVAGGSAASLLLVDRGGTRYDFVFP